MVANRHITKIIILVMAAAVFACVLAMAFPQELARTVGGAGVEMAYRTRLFDDVNVIKIDIRMEDGQWEDMLENAIAEEYFSCDVEINGEKVRNVGIRPKGNTSLSAIAMNPESDRFSLKLEFDHYVEGQTCLGLDKLVLNNNYADATNMKEAVVYDMYQYLGANASLYNYAEISVNGTYLGVYLALEAVEESFLLRNFGTEDGKLYKPEGMDMGGMGGEPSKAAGTFMGSGGADLNYTDDDPDSYSTIWEGEVTDSGKKDHGRVVAALKNISQGTELERYLDIDNVLKYMAVHTFSVNMDSLSGNMAHNYYLYEHNGKLNILPWDYNLSFGGMGMGTASSASGVINDAIDDPFQGTAFFDALLEDEAYLARYHGYLRKLAEEYVFGGKFEDVYHGIRSRIDDLVETDPTAFYTAAEYETAAEMLYQTVMLRAESIRGQLEGTIPSTDAGQQADAAGLVDASAIDIEAMGVFDMGAGGFRPNETHMRSFAAGEENTDTDAREGVRPWDGTAGEPGEMPESFREPEKSGEDDGDMERWLRAPEGMPGSMQEGFGTPEMPGEWGMPDRDFGGNDNTGTPPAGESPQKAFRNGNSRIDPRNAAVYAGCLLAAVSALAAAGRFRRVPGRKRRR